MEKVELQTADIAAENAVKLAELFPDVVTEVLDEDGKVCHGIDVEALKAHVGDIAEDKRERYQFTWPGKQRARAEAIRPISKTMRPAPEESVNWDSTENLYIEGDNLDALKILRETYAGKIKMIYIDPPYNTGHDFIYKDSRKQSKEDMDALSSIRDDEGNQMGSRFELNSEASGTFHSDWCSMMYSRLLLAKDLLREDGIVFISIDENEFKTLGLICDEVFGSQNLVECFVYDKKAAAKGVPPVNMVCGVHEYIFAYAKSASEFRFIGIPRSLDGFSNPDNDPRGPWRNTNIKSTTSENRFTITDPDTGFSFTDTWAFSPKELNRLISEKRLLFPKSPSGQVRAKEYYSEFKNACTPIKSSLGLYDAQWNTEMLVKLMGGKFFQNPKHLKLMKDLVAYTANGDCFVLDFFSGSATTAHAVMQLNAEDGGNRKFIMVQLPEVCDEKSEAAKAGYSTICEIGKERIRRTGAKIAAEAEDANAQLKLGEEPKKVPDIGFRVLKIDSTNFEDVSRTPDVIQQDQLFGLADNLKSDRTPEDILFELLPKFQIPYTARIDKLDLCGKTVYSVDDDTLLACFDREVPEGAVRVMAEREPAYAVLRDVSFVGDDALANFEEIFKTLSPATKTRVV